MTEYELEYEYKGDVFIEEGIIFYRTALQRKEELEEKYKNYNVKVKINKIE